MTNASADEIVDTALAKDQLDRLLLGESEYQYLPRHSPSPWNTDLTELLSVLYRQEDRLQQEKIKNALYNAIRTIVPTYGGVLPTAICILFESLRRSRNQPALGLPLEEIASELRDSISNNKPKLMDDKSGPGFQWQDGLLDELKCLSKNTESFPGPAFYPE